MTHFRLLAFLVLLTCVPHSSMSESLKRVVVTKSLCLEAKFHDPPSPLEEHCCDSFIDSSPEAKECATANTNSKLNEDEVFAKLGNCYFVKKKFTKGPENLNFKRIQADIDKLDDPREREFMTKVYRRCNARAKIQLETAKGQTQPGSVPLGLRRPFFAFMFLCVSTYSKILSCPYFLWSSECAVQREKCRKLLADEKL